MSSERIAAKTASKPTTSQLVQQAQGPASPRLDQGVVQRTQLGAGALSAGDLLALQRSIGNRAVARLVGAQRSAAAPATPPLIQAKLQVGPANDAYEQEADRIADSVLQAQRSEDESAVDVAATPTIRRLQRQAQAPMGAAGGEVSSDVERRLQTSKATGSSLPGSVRQTLEPKLGADLGRVKVHTDSQSAQLNRELGAKAFTHKNHIYFGAGQSPSNLKLTAHEVVHTIQQGAVKQTQRKTAGSLGKGSGKRIDKDLG